MKRHSLKIAGAVFLVVGLALLGAGGAWYYYAVERPLTWPRTDATVVSGRVINPRNPNQHKSELVLRVQTAGGPRQVTVRGSWDSSSYDMVKSHVDRYPPGSTVEVAINPADENDVRYDLGGTLTNLIGPGILGIMGLIFTGIGVGTLARSGRQQRAASPADNTRLTRRVAWIFAAIGVGILGLGVWLVSRDVAMLRSWQPVEAESVAVRPISSRSSIGNRPSQLVYDVQVTFRYAVGGTRFESQTTSGLASSSLRRRDELMKQFAPGTRHRIHHRPDDPNVIRYNLAWSLTTFALSGGMLAMGLVFLGFGILFLRLTRAAGRARAARARPPGRWRR
jgi:hypothetical protein